MLQRNEGAEIDGHSLWGNDDASLDPIRVLSAAELEAYAIPTKEKSNAKNDLQQIDPTGTILNSCGSCMVQLRKESRWATSLFTVNNM
ncbi:hypothetical protein RchiOBHm_Chr1g0316731 [Rosa chinensis]|uniref:Uncharacterized protein n=1 Tax=Rosa chinensis TaxID=74649 RepID=A0A2P6S7P7_ROSCH|nr:hypothetical protein RchiOBHm_Chr1g0316731 [Rosa chinensis]